MQLKVLVIILGWLILFSPQSYSADIWVNALLASNPFQDDGQCTLPEAVLATNTNSASGITVGECAAGESLPEIDQIRFAKEILPATINLESPLEIIESVSILGPHMDLLTISGIGSDRVMVIDNAAVAAFEIKNLTISGGYAGVGIVPDNTGGGMFVSLSSSSLLLERVRFINNNAEYAGGALSIGYGDSNGNVTIINQCEFIDNTSIGSTLLANGNTGGGGAIFIAAFQTVEVKNSTFTGNRAINIPTNSPLADAYGGAIWILSSSSAAVSSLNIESSTFHVNQANGVGGAIAIGGPGFPSDVSLVDIKHSTFTANSADDNSSNTGSAGGGIYTTSSSPVNIFNSIIARNSDNSTNSRPNLSGQFNSIGHNFINGNQGISGDFPFGLPNINDDFVGSAFASPRLEPLDYYGGPTMTRPLLDDSSLIDQGKCGAMLTDQRDYYNEVTLTRAVDNPSVNDFVGACDIGAVELDTTNLNPLPQLNSDSYTILEDQTLTANDPFGTLTPANTSDDGLLANDLDDDPLYVLNAGQINLNSVSMTDPGYINLLVDGTFTYTPPTNEFGTAFNAYHVSDQINQDSLIFSIQVQPVNDAPSFIIPGSTWFNLVTDTPTLFNVPEWAAKMNAGADNESDQQLSFSYTYTQGDDSFFELPPTIDAQTGDLSFQFAAHITAAQVIFNLYLTDDGGTDNGGVDTSSSQLITINISQPDVIFKDSFEVDNSN